MVDYLLSSAELYDPATGSWSSTGSLVTARDMHTATLLPSGAVLVAGGYGASYCLNSAELYDPATWKLEQHQQPRHRALRSHGDAAALGEVLVAGGYDCRVLP